ncbi:MAG: helix-turn-helix domain-containing protein [Verrucomicrobiota bacterium]|jgi:transcriptional regulator with XRE-family HTH domain
MNASQSITVETGRKLRALRLRAHLSMRELARQAGVAASYVSNLEAGRVSATLASLRKLLVVLSPDIGPFFALARPAVEGWVFRRQQMQTTSDAGRSYTFILPVRADLRLNMMDEELFAGEQPEFETLDGDLAGYVLSGELVLEFEGEKPQILHAGDAFYAPAGRPVPGGCGWGKSVRLVTVAMQQGHPRLRNRSIRENRGSTEPSRRPLGTARAGRKSKSRRRPFSRPCP